MRLLNTSTLKLHELIVYIPEYVILSQMWAAGKVMLDDINKLRTKNMPVIEKFRNAVS